MNLNGYLRGLFAALLVAGVGLTGVSGARAADPAEQVRQILKEHPEIILDVLKEHSEEMLEIVQRGADDRRTRMLHVQWKSDAQNPKEVALVDRPVRGPADAAITLVAFSDFTCSYCQQAAYTVENLLRRYPEKIRVVYKQIPNTDAGKLAARWFLAASWQDSDKAWKMYAKLFDRQSRLIPNTEATLRETAVEVGLNVNKLDEALRDSAKRFDDVLTGDQNDARRLGFSGTPYFLVNDLIIRGAVSLDDFADAVETALKLKK